MKSVVIVFLCSVLLCCKSKNSVTEKEMLEYVADPANGLKKTSTNGLVHVDVIYKPVDLLKFEETNDIQNAEQRAREGQRLDSLSYFIVRIARGGKEIENSFLSERDKMIDYLKTGIINDIFIATSSDTIEALDVVYTPMFGASDATSLLTVFDFDVRKADGNVNFYIHSDEPQIGHHRVEFDYDNIKKIPVLNQY